MEYIPSQPLTVGVELEFQLLDRESLDLVNGIQPLIDLYPDSPYIKPEFNQNTVEVASKIGNTVTELHPHFKDISLELKRSCLNLNMELCAAGTHPFSKNLALFTPLPRYLKMEQMSGYVGHNQLTYATHVHVGITNADDAIYIMRAIKPYLPILIALSSSSPFWRGYDTAYVSYRHRILAASRSYGIPPSFEDWDQFIDFFNASRRAGIMHSMNDVHWDIRIRPHLGTVEVRAMDAQPRISEAMELASFVRILTAWLLQHQHTSVELALPHALPWWLEKDNHFMASRLGWNANIITSKHGAIHSLRSLWHLLVDEIKPVAERIGETDYFHSLVERIEQDDLSSTRQRQIYKNTGNLESVVTSLIDELEADTGFLNR